jgi:hypothetical protein
MPDAPQEFASGLDTDLRKLAQQVQNSERMTTSEEGHMRRSQACLPANVLAIYDCV